MGRVSERGRQTRLDSRARSGDKRESLDAVILSGAKHRKDFGA